MLKEGWEDQHCVTGSGLTSLIHRGRDKRAVLLLQESCIVTTRELYCCYKRAVLLLQERRMVRELYCYSQPLVGGGGGQETGNLRQLFTICSHLGLFEYNDGGYVTFL